MGIFGVSSSCQEYAQNLLHGLVVCGLLSWWIYVGSLRVPEKAVNVTSYNPSRVMKWSSSYNKLIIAFGYLILVLILDNPDKDPQDGIFRRCRSKDKSHYNS